MPAGTSPQGRTGRRIRVRGQVQGVGYRPFVWQLAQSHGICGSVLNDAEGVLIEATGNDLDAFVRALKDQAPPLAVVTAVEVEPADLTATEDFVILSSGGPGAETRVTPDAATCPDCAAEIRAPGRRHGYAFTNCTNCGPRFTILTGLPYDRAQTTMAGFTLCPECRGEYEDPGDRRFHAQPVACPACGPSLWFETDGERQDGDCISAAADMLLAGGIVAVKGLGGFHLACDATNATAVQLLRERKRRPAKPFALTAPLDFVRRHARVDDASADLLSSAAAPVVLLEAIGEKLPRAIAPGQATLGWMLPYTPLHHLLCDLVGRPLVMTSGNLSGEPQVIGNEEAREKLPDFADGFLMHDRDIARRLDDSVERVTPQGLMTLRRARGRGPGTLPLPDSLHRRQVIAFGGQMKSAICLVKNGEALLGHHLGELDEALTWEAFLQSEADYSALFDHRPEAIAVDLHPDFRATRHGHDRATAEGLRVVEVQHHHAHMAACLGEAGWHGETAIGIVLDGLGLGPDGTVWGGEVLVGGYRDVHRGFSLAPAPLLGGDRAQAEPWRNALVRLDAAGLSDLADRLFADTPLEAARSAVRAGVNARLSSSVGRLFDAVAACLGLCALGQSFEGEAAMRLEAMATSATGSVQPYPGDSSGHQLDPSAMFRGLDQDLEAKVPHDVIAMRFHRFVATHFAAAAMRLAAENNTRTIALSGGCFQNALLLDLTCRALDGYDVLTHHLTPANDGGLAFGQALVALAQLETD